MRSFGVFGSFIMSCALVLPSCSRSPYPGFKPVAEEVHFTLRMLGDGEHLVDEDDSVFVRVRMARHGEDPGTLFSTERWYRSIDAVLPEGALSAVHLHEGDSVGFITFGRHIPWVGLGSEQQSVPDTVLVDMELSLRTVGAPGGQIAPVPDPPGLLTAADEAEVLKHYLDSSAIQWKNVLGVHYILDTVKAKRGLVRWGERITIHYQAHSIVDGTLIDDTHKAGQPLTFRLGDPGQVIRGLEIAVQQLRKGGRGRFIIPSELAFGAEGSSNGLVPPHTPLIYTVEVMDAVEDAEVAVDTTAWPM